MSEVSRVYVPPSFSFLLGAASLIGVFVFFYFFASSWRPRPQNLRDAQLKIRVWADKSAGLYYCPNSTLYGRTQSGRYMSQGEALQTGYAAALNEPCK
jgi:hypothetical protein